MVTSAFPSSVRGQGKAAWGVGPRQEERDGEAVAPPSPTWAPPSCSSESRLMLRGGSRTSRCRVSAQTTCRGEDGHWTVCIRKSLINGGGGAKLEKRLRCQRAPTTLQFKLILDAGAASQDCGARATRQ